MSDPPFVPTHFVPEYGLEVRDAPDGALSPSAMLPAGLGVRLLQRQGAWADVVVADGRHGWVDGRMLIEIGPSDSILPPITGTRGSPSPPAVPTPAPPPTRAATAPPAGPPTGTPTPPTPSGAAPPAPPPARPVAPAPQAAPAPHAAPPPAAPPAGPPATAPAPQAVPPPGAPPAESPAAATAPQAVPPPGAPPAESPAAATAAQAVPPPGTPAPGAPRATAPAPGPPPHPAHGVAGPPRGATAADAPTALVPSGIASQEPTAEFPAAAPPRRLAFSPAAAGGLVAAFGAFLPWLGDYWYESQTAFGLPITFLARRNRFYADDPVSVGVAVVVIALAGVLLSVVPHPISSLRRLCGLGLLACAGALWAQLQFGEDQSFTFTLKELIGVGVYVTAAGGLGLLLAPGPRPGPAR